MPHNRGLMWVAVFAVALAGCEQAPASSSPGQADRGDSRAAPSKDRDTAAVLAAPSDSVLTAEGWQRLRIGMTRAEVVAAAGEDAFPDMPGGADPTTCDEFRPVNAPDGLLVMIRSGRLSRVSISEGTGIVTDQGIAVGDSVTTVRNAYGAAVVSSPHPYQSAPAQHLTVWRVRPPSTSARGIVYEVEANGRVRKILAGDESIEFPEGCF